MGGGSDGTGASARRRARDNTRVCRDCDGPGVSSTVHRRDRRPPAKGSPADAVRLTRQPGPDRLPPGPRLHGHVRVLRPARRRRVDRHDPPGARAGRDPARHLRHLRPAHERAARRPRDRRPARRGRAGDEVRHRARPRRPGQARRRRPAGVRPRRPARRRCGASASTTSTSTTSTASTPTRRSRRRSARWRSSSPRARSASSGCPRRRPRRSAARTPCTRSPRCRASTRSGRASRRRRSCRRVRELGIGFVPYSPLGRGFLTGKLRSLDAARGRRLPPLPAALPGRQPRGQHRDRRADRRARGGQGRHAGAGRAGVGARAGRGRRADPGHQAAQLPRGERRRARRAS